MLFKDLKANYPIFIFNRDSITVEEGKVVNIGIPHYDIHYNTNDGMVTDFAIKIGDIVKTYTFKDSSEVGYSDNLVISPNREAILREVEVLKEQTEQQLKLVETNKKTLEKCVSILATFNPALKEKKETEERFSKLETSVGDIKQMLSNLMNKLNDNNNG